MSKRHQRPPVDLEWIGLRSSTSRKR